MPLLRAQATRLRRALLRAFVALACLLPARARADIALPEPNPELPIVVTADTGTHWTEGAYDVWLLEGNCQLGQGPATARSRSAVLWIDNTRPAGQPHKIIAYLDGEVSADYRAVPTERGRGGPLSARLTDASWLHRFYSTGQPDVRVQRASFESTAKPPVYGRALAAREAELKDSVKQTQYAEPIGRPQAVAPNVPPVGSRRLRIFPRSEVPLQIQGSRNETAGEWVVVVTSGVNLIVDGIENLGSIDVAADRLVIWSKGSQALDFSSSTLQDNNTPLEIYMEGNIVFRQGDRIVYATQMYYDVQQKRGMILGGELLTPVRDYDGLLRLRADVIQQVTENSFVAENASLTSSRFGIPGYEFRSGTLAFTDTASPVVNPFTGEPAVDPVTQAPVVHHQRLATSSNNFIYVEDVPVFYWPVLATDLRKPNFYIDRIRFKNDRVFGTQVLADLDMYQILGISEPPAGTNWDLSLDYLSDRGPAAGTSFNYDREGLFGVPGRYYGLFDAWGIKDDGFDNLGRDRRAVQPEEDFRGRILGRHRQFLPDNYQLTAEVGLISDRNFLEQYFENEWDDFKDQTTGIELKRIRDNSSLSLAGDVRINDFFTETSDVRLDYYLLGEPLFNDTLTWYQHSHIGYFDLEAASTPLDPVQAAETAPLPWEIDSQGERIISRQEIDGPLALGPVKLVPYALGELGHWGEVLDGEDTQRAYGQLGLRASIPFWAVDPTVESQLFNLHGIAHKVVFDTDIAVTDSNRDVDDFPLYDPLDDNNIEAFRRRFTFDTFGGPPVPRRFDERDWAVCRGLGGNVTSPATEVVDDLLAARFGLRQRWQTKRGPLGARRIVDWITFDTQAVVFPEADRDNFGESLGMVEYNFRWHVGDRLTLLSDGYYEFYDEGPQYTTIGAFLNRPQRGSLFIGFRSLEGPITSNVLAAAVNYRMSPKWATTIGTTYDFSDEGNIGQNLLLTRIGESLLVSMGLNYDASKNNFGANFLVEPRFLPRGKFGTASSLAVPPAGAFGLE